MEQTGNPNQKTPIWAVVIILICVPLGIFLWHRNTTHTPVQESPEKQALDRQVSAKWGKPFTELPTENLIIVSPHNEMIREKFEHAFVKYYAVEKGRHVLVWWHQRGGSNAILDFLMRENPHNLGLDVVFGGGEYLFEQLAGNDLLVPLQLEQTVLDQIPSELAGVRLRDPQLRWCGNVLSGFGILYNNSQIEALGINTPQTWTDLARPELFGRIAVADPQNSGSTVMAFEMILQSEPNWQAGWKKLLGILSNTREFMASSEDAANAPLFDQAAAAICIDFYGIGRMTLDREKLTYVNPAGGTAFMPDPIGILKDAPNSDIAREFVKYVLSPQGQTLWGTQSSQKTAMAVDALYRTPIRKDFYATPADAIPEVIQNPYQAAQTVQIDSELRLVRYHVLRQLVHAAAVANFEAMTAARHKLIESGNNEALAKAFYALPENVNTVDAIRSVAERMKDPQQAETMTAEWVEFFKNQFEKAAG